MKVPEEGVFKAEVQSLSRNSRIVSANEELSEDVKSAPSASTPPTIRKESVITDMDKSLGGLHRSEQPCIPRVIPHPEQDLTSVL